MLKIEGFDENWSEGRPGGGASEGDDLEEEGAGGCDLEVERRRREAEAIYGADDEVGGAIDASWEELFETGNSYTITKLTAGVRDPNRVNVFLDGTFAFSLDVTQVVDLNVKVGQKVSAERLKELREASEFGKLYQRTLEWALVRPRSVRETKDYLRRRQFKRVQLNRQRVREEKRPLAELKDETMALVVERLEEKGHLDDRKFAEFYVQNRLVRKGVSAKRLALELKRKGVGDATIRAALEKMDRPEEEEIMKVVKKKRAKYDDRQLVSYLVRQGFSYQKAKDAVESYRPED